ncbi:protein terminal ear1 homolog [Solanum lycopersicum]|uniref:Mei2-like C-terminal RNA recognition motif domain-containing protein n=1 Tax=Solanum lycopersicum TaxID=4081 RepID=A0A3Q7HI21_SOLLC|nr:protein terminal ear1 homolog [Solanum lycopersicum]
MAALNPNAEEFKPTNNEKEVVPFNPQGNELVVYQPPLLPFHVSQPQCHHLGYFYYYQQNVPFYWIHDDLYHQLENTPQTQSFLAKGEIFSDGVKEKWVWVEKTHQDQSFVDKDEIFSDGMNKNWKNKKPFLPPRLMRTPASVWKPKGFVMRKPQQENGSSISSCKSSAALFSWDKTTVMIRNIPNQFRREPFMLFLDHYCSLNHWEYDFLYLPMDFRTNNNVGYAFVNFTSGCAASEIREVLRYFKWTSVETPTGIFSSRKICVVSWARIQGKDLLVKHFSQSKFICDTDEYLPVVFSPPRNGSSRLTAPMTIGNLAVGPSVSSSSVTTN